jgi:hypothetical protein
LSFQKSAGVFGGAGFDAGLGVAAVDIGADFGGLGGAQGSALQEGVAEFVGGDAVAFGVEIDEDAGFFARRGLDEEAGGTGLKLGFGVFNVIRIAFFGHATERDEFDFVAEDALHGGHVAELLRGVGLSEAGDISSGEFDIEEHAADVGGAGFGAALAHAPYPVVGSAYGTEGGTDAEHVACGLLFFGVEGEGDEGRVGGGTFGGSAGDGAGSADALDDEGIGEALHDGAGLRAEAGIGGEAGGGGFDGAEFGGVLQDFADGGEFRERAELGGDGGLGDGVEAICGIGGDAENGGGGPGDFLDGA